MTENFTGGARLWEEIVTLFVDPSSNAQAALLLYAIIAILLVIIATAGILFIIAVPSRPKRPRESAELVAPSQAQSAVDAGRVQSKATPARGVVVGTALAFAVVVWLVAGYTTAGSAVCESCHVTTPHSASEPDRDPHVSVSCSACHGLGGTIGRYVFDLPARVAHLVGGVAQYTLQEGFGQVRQSACLSCHRSGISEVTVDEERGLRMSHREPLEAAALCLDCHPLDDGAIAAYRAGMNPCLRCHDSVIAASECSTCHDRKAAAAALSRSGDFADAQVTELRCGGCHDEAAQCDPCHGTRMPHSWEFRVYAHARPGVVDLWFNDGQACGRCHTAERRPCTRCHTPMLGRGHPEQAQSHQTAAEVACNTCHHRWAFTPQRDFCTDVCHTPAAVEYSPR